MSFDGSSLHLPPEVTKKGWNRGNTWFHTDQSYEKNNFECLQSFVSLLDINDGDATLAFMEKSNKFHGAFAREFKIKEKGDWYKLDETEEEFYVERKCAYKKIKCPKGSMVFWDSRTIHCGVEPLKERTIENIRAVIYLCYMPKSLITSGKLKKKKDAFNDLRTTSHWPCNPKLFGTKPNTYGNILKQVTPINPPVLIDLGKKIAGFNIKSDSESEPESEPEHENIKKKPKNFQKN